MQGHLLIAFRGALLSLTITILTGVPQLRGQNAAKIDGFFHFRSGTEWKYRERINLAAPFDDSRVLGEVTVKEGRVTAGLLTHRPWGTGIRTYSEDAHGLYEETLFGRVQLLRYPVKSGDNWVQHLKVPVGSGLDQEITTTVVGESRIKVPAGTYTAVEVKSVNVTKREKTTETVWYVKNLGVAKRDYVVQSLLDVKERFDLQQELAKFIPGK